MSVSPKSIASSHAIEIDASEKEENVSTSDPKPEAPSTKTSRERASNGNQSSHVIPVWRVWPGNNQFCFSGRLMLGSHTKGPIATLLLVLIPSAFYFGAIVPDLKGTTFIIVVMLNILLLLGTVIFLLKTITTDPGIIPRKKVPDRMTRSMFSSVPRYIKDEVCAY